DSATAAVSASLGALLVRQRSANLLARVLLGRLLAEERPFVLAAHTELLRVACAHLSALHGLVFASIVAARAAAAASGSASYAATPTLPALAARLASPRTARFLVGVRQSVHVVAALR